MKKLRCAIYTRKSSEEGLEQEFNSLHAQRDACAAYITSQKHEGWEEMPEQYDDGGFSGGNMERPALKRLMADIEAGLVNVIIVYKIDRLSRSIADFMKIVEVLEKHSVAFVSVTQSFNTQNSMGKLMLNILLSFAQFEREVTGERIRDKIAASKKKGMWMGGTTPLGYDLKDRKLLVNKEEASAVNYIFNRYLELKSVNLLKVDLEFQNYKTKSRDGKERNFSKGHLYHILQNRLYLGEINHKGNSYDGEHTGIIDSTIFDAVQDCLKNNRVSRSNAIGTKSPCLLARKLFDDMGNYMSPKHAGTHKRHYRYYTSHAIIKSDGAKAGSLPNIPAHEIEAVVVDEFVKLLRDTEEIQTHIDLSGVAEQGELLNNAVKLALLLETGEPSTRRWIIRSLLAKAIISNKALELYVCRVNLLQLLNNPSELGLVDSDIADTFIIKREIKLAATNDGSKVITGKISAGCNMTLVKAIARSFLWHEQIISGEVRTREEIMKREKMKSMAYIEKIMKLRFLPPHIIESIIMGNQPAEWTVEKLLKF